MKNLKSAVITFVAAVITVVAVGVFSGQNIQWGATIIFSLIVTVARIVVEWIVRAVQK